MTLRQRLALHYGAIVLVALSLVTGLTYHEVATERRLRALLKPIDESEVGRRKVFDVTVFSVVPVVLVAGWWFARRSLLPISRLVKSVERVQADNLRQPLSRSGNGDEVDRLTEAFNAMTARLDESFQQIREFTLHASHELKTPLTVMRGELETAMQDTGSYSQRQRECLHSLLDEVQRLARIVDMLTLLTKADAGQINLVRQPVRLAELVRESFEDALILAEPLNIKVTLEECVDVVVTGDRHRLRQLLLNLVDNAVKYNWPSGTVTMSLRHSDGTAEVEIANTGNGIPAELQPRIFDRFVRGDTTHIDGCGLGLTIAQWIVRAHGGSLLLSSVPGKTTTALVRLPLGIAESLSALPKMKNR
jgi:signal transduction histidine kinase